RGAAGLALPQLRRGQARDAGAPADGDPREGQAQVARRAQGPHPPRRAAVARAARRRTMSRLDLTGIPECTACGTCCFSTLPEYIRVFGVDLDRMDDRAQALTHFLG